MLPRMRVRLMRWRRFMAFPPPARGLSSLGSLCLARAVEPALEDQRRRVRVKRGVAVGAPRLAGALFGLARAHALVDEEDLEPRGPPERARETLHAADLLAALLPFESERHAHDDRAGIRVAGHRRDRLGRLAHGGYLQHAERPRK